MLSPYPLAPGRQILDAHRRRDIQPHAIPEEFVDPLGVGARDPLDQRDQPGVQATYPIANHLVVAGGICLVLEHQVAAM